HGIGRDDVPLDQALLKGGFLDVLRPFTGLKEDNFLQVMEAIIALRPHLVGETMWERRLVEGIWGMTMGGRMWGLDPGGMLQRNRLLTATETSRLRLWVDCIEMAVSRLFRSGDPGEALIYYQETKRSTGTQG